MRRYVGFVVITFAFISSLIVQTVNAETIKLQAIDADTRLAPVVRPKSAIIENRPIWDYNLGKVVGLEQRVRTIKNKRIVKLYPYSQTLMTKSLTYLEPESSYAVASSCSNPVEVDVLAVQMTYGSGGPAVLARADSRYVPTGMNATAGDPPWEEQEFPMGSSDPLLLDELLPAAPDEASITFSSGAELELKVKAAYPDFNAPQFYREFTNNDDTNAIVLVNGNDVLNILAQKGAQAPYAAQQSVPQILNSFGLLAPDGRTVQNLLPTEMIYLYELGTTNPLSSAFDFQDAVLKVTMPCEVGQEVVLRDSIGIDNNSTNGNFPYKSDSNPPFFTYISPATVVASENVTLKNVRAILGRMSPQHNFAQLDYWVRVWSSEAAAIANPGNGDIANIFFAVPTAGPTSWGITMSQPGLGTQPTFDLSFDVLGSGVQILAGQTRLIGVQVMTFGGPNGGLWGIQESTEFGPSDIGVSSPGNWIYIKDESHSLHDGRLGFEIRGETF